MDHATDSALQRRAMNISLVVGIGMLLAKGTAYFITASTAVLSDAAESVVHVAAVGFAAYSLWLSHQPPDRNHLYGHEKIGFLSAGFEGGLIGLAGLIVIYESVEQWIAGPAINQIDFGIIITLATMSVNGLLGWYLVRTGRRQNCLILVANGKHVLTDSWTSLGALAALALVQMTGILYFDPIIAIIMATNILWAGVNLIWTSLRGLMDEADPELDRRIRAVLDQWSESTASRFHGLRHRRAGNTVWMELHVLLPGRLSLSQAHDVATELEQRLEADLSPINVTITTHIEPLEEHDELHRDDPQHQLMPD